MSDLTRYKRTVYGCYLALITQAFCVCATAMLFVALKNQYELSYTQLGALTFVNFGVQLLIDFTVSSQVDKWGFKKVAIAAPFLVIIGTVIFVIAPEILSKPYPLFVIGTAIFAGASGLLEVSVSPIMDNLPTENKEKAMGMLHGFYGVGQILVVVGITLLVLWLGEENWQIILSVFLVLPLASLIVFAKAPFVDSRQNGRDLKYREFLGKPMFWLFMAAIVGGGACELIMGQWASSFFETTFGLKKWVGDLTAVATFAGTLTIGRLIYGKLGDRINLSVACIGGSALCLVCYVGMAISNNPWASIALCGISGLGVSMLWPGTLSLATKAFPRTSTKFFGALSGGGDTGNAFGPLITGVVADYVVLMPFVQSLAERSDTTAESLGFKAGLLVGALFATLSLICHIAIKARLGKGDAVSSTKHD